MSRNINRLGKKAKKLSISVAIDHLLVIPKYIVIFLGIMNSGDKREAFVIDRIALVYRKV